MSMHLYNEDDPNDSASIRHKKKWRRAQLEQILNLQKILNGAGLGVEFNAKPDFDRAANNNDSVSFLTHSISGVSKENDPKVFAVYDEHFTVFYEPAADKKPESFLVRDLDLDYLTGSSVDMEIAVLEKVKCALLLAHSAKAAGWTKVNFMDTTDPLSRYVLALACKECGLDIGEEKNKIDMAPIENLMIGKEKLIDVAYTHLNNIMLNPRTSVATPKHRGKNDAADNDNNADSFGFDIAN